MVEMKSFRGGTHAELSVEMGVGEAERPPVCRKNFKALLYDNENLCTLK